MLKAKKLLQIFFYMSIYIGSCCGILLNSSNEIANFDQIKSINFPPNVSVVSVDLNDHCNIATWAQIVLESFSHIPSEQYLLDWISDLKVNVLTENLKLYFGFYNDEPVGVAILVNSSLISTVHWLAIKPEYLDKAIGAALLKQINHDAQLAGFNFVALVSITQLKNLR